MTYPGGGQRISKDATSKSASVQTRKQGVFKPVIRKVLRRGKSK